MPDAYLIFTKPLPFAVSLNGRSWAISAAPGMKSGTVAILAVETSGSVQNRKWYTFTAGRDRDVENDLRRGIRVRSGTPERGLATALRRAGLAELLAARR